MYTVYLNRWEQKSNNFFFFLHRNSKINLKNSVSKLNSKICFFRKNILSFEKKNWENFPTFALHATRILYSDSLCSLEALNTYTDVHSTMHWWLHTHAASTSNHMKQTKTDYRSIHTFWWRICIEFVFVLKEQKNEKEAENIPGINTRFPWQGRCMHSYHTLFNDIKIVFLCNPT